MEGTAGEIEKWCWYRKCVLSGPSFLINGVPRFCFWEGYTLHNICLKWYIYVQYGVLRIISNLIIKGTLPYASSSAFNSCWLRKYIIAKSHYKNFKWVFFKIKAFAHSEGTHMWKLWLVESIDSLISCFVYAPGMFRSHLSVAHCHLTLECGGEFCLKIWATVEILEWQESSFSTSSRNSSCLFNARQRTLC